MQSSAQLGNLPLELTSFVGREAELRELERLLDSTRVLTLTGLGGIGKTRLALALARRLGHRFPEGVRIAELVGLTDGSLVAEVVGAAVGIGEHDATPARERLVSMLARGQRLLILDNCEHLLAACVELVDLLAGSCAELHIIVTSRARLGVRGEVLFQVPPLALPETQSTPAELATWAAPQLFLERARAVQPIFAIDETNAAAVVELCRKLDGIPLALELAAARVRILSPAQISSRLNDRFRLLVAGAAGADRHDRLSAALDWSYELLAEPERRLFARLAVFAGSFALEAVGATMAGPAGDVLDSLQQLVDQSLVLAEPTRGGPVRFRLLETVRHYAAERLANTIDVESAERRHAEWFANLTEAAEPRLVGRDQGRVLLELDLDLDNIRRALAWTLQHEPLLALRMVGALRVYWRVRGLLAEGRAWADRALAFRGPVPEALLGRALHTAGSLAVHQGDYEAALRFEERSLALRRQVDDVPGLIASLNDLGIIAAETGEYGAARARYEECLALARATGAKRETAVALNNLGLLAQYRREFDYAVELHEQSMAIHGELGNTSAIAVTLNNLGYLAIEQGQYSTARGRHQAALRLYAELEDRRGLAETLEALARVLRSTSRAGDAARLYGAAAALRDAIGTPVPPGDRDEYKRQIDEVRAVLGSDAFERLRGEGRSSPLERVLDLALSEPPMTDALSRLTRRELEVAGLLARGMTNRQIADVLVITEGTAGIHVEHILGKLGFHSRAQVAAWFVERRSHGSDSPSAAR